MTRILLNHSIRNPLSFLLIFFLIFSVFIFSMPSKSVNDSKTIYVLKTIIYNDIFTSLGHKKFKVRLNTESLSMKWNRRLRGLIMFAFNFGVESLEQSVKLSLLEIFNFLGNSVL